MPNYSIVPSVDENNDFPPEIRSRIAQATELVSKFALKSELGEGDGNGGGTGGAVSSVFGRTGDVTGTSADVGLGNVSNIAPADLPVSTAAQAALNTKADLINGLIPTIQMPSIALTTAVSVASQAAMLALTATQVQPGDVAVRTDGAGSFILVNSPASSLANWTKLNAPTDVVSSVNGKIGTVVLGKEDLGVYTLGVNDPAGVIPAGSIILRGPIT